MYSITRTFDLHYATYVTEWDKVKEWVEMCNPSPNKITLCREVMAKFWNIPRTANRIEVVLSDRYVRGAYRVKIDTWYGLNEGCFLGGHKVPLRMWTGFILDNFLSRGRRKGWVKVYYYEPT